jgi:hypothetical protein
MFIEPMHRVTQTPGRIGKVFVSGLCQVFESLLCRGHIVTQVLLDLLQEFTASLFHLVEDLLVALQIDSQALLDLLLLAVGVCQALGLRGREPRHPLDRITGLFQRFHGTSGGSDHGSGLCGNAFKPGRHRGILAQGTFELP